jgi:hypothetical protein
MASMKKGPAGLRVYVEASRLGLSGPVSCPVSFLLLQVTTFQSGVTFKPFPVLKSCGLRFLLLVFVADTPSRWLSTVGFFEQVNMWVLLGPMWAVAGRRCSLGKVVSMVRITSCRTPSM